MGLICEALDTWLPDNFFVVYPLVVIGIVLTLLLTSGSCFRWLYSNANFAKWQYKTNPEFPPPSVVRQEIMKTMLGVCFAGFFPALTLYLRHSQWTTGYCHHSSYGQYLLEFLALVFCTDFIEWFYHWAGHRFDTLWDFHRHHHKFFNPTPWAVIADEPMDNIFRSFPILLWNLVFPQIHLELLLFTFTVFFYLYGIYLHCGYECDWIVASDNPIVNTSVQHYLHHATGGRKDPCHTGFMLKVWDWLIGTYYKGDLSLVESRKHFAITQRQNGERTWDKWINIRKKFPNYGLLLQPMFWIDQRPETWAKQEYLDLSAGEVEPTSAKQDFVPVGWRAIFQVCPVLLLCCLAWQLAV